MDGEDGIVNVAVQGRRGGEAGSVALDRRREPLLPTTNGASMAELRVPGVERWWPHTHGSPALHELTVELDGEVAATRQVGFRTPALVPGDP